MPRSNPLLIAAFLLCCADGAAPAAELPATPHVRSGDHQVADLIAEGMRRPPAFAGLVERLDESDVVVYVTIDDAIPSGLGGWTRFVGQVAGRRYVAVGLCRRLSADQRIMMIAHELRHAVEIAEARTVADDSALAAHYRAIGFRTWPCRNECYESTAAVDAERQVGRELRRRSRAYAQH